MNVTVALEHRFDVTLEGTLWTETTFATRFGVDIPRLSYTCACIRYPRPSRDKNEPMTKNTNKGPARTLQLGVGSNRAGLKTWLVHVLRHIDRERLYMDFSKEAAQTQDHADEIRSLGSKLVRGPRYRRRMGTGCPALEVRI